MNKTFDILDALMSDFKEWCNPKFEFRHRHYSETITMDIPNWEKYYDEVEPFNLKWDEFKYDSVKSATDLDNIVDQDSPGIYMFIVKPNKSIHNMPQNVLYIGIAGATMPQRSLKMRLKDYYSLSTVKKRDAVMRLLQKYFPNVYIAYSYCAEPPATLAKIETSLIGFFYPIANKDDFPVNLKQEQKAF